MRFNGYVAELKTYAVGYSYALPLLLYHPPQSVNIECQSRNPSTCFKIESLKMSSFLPSGDFNRDVYIIVY
jgi:hypothetical protein